MTNQSCASNLYSNILLERFSYMQMNRQHGAYLGYFYGPLFFILAILSCCLGAMQVILQAQGLLPNQQVSLAARSRRSSTFLVVSLVTLSTGLAMMLIEKIANEWIFAFRTKEEKGKKLHQKVLMRWVLGRRFERDRCLEDPQDVTLSHNPSKALAPIRVSSLRSILDTVNGWS